MRLFLLIELICAVLSILGYFLNTLKYKWYAETCNYIFGEFPALPNFRDVVLVHQNFQREEI